MPEQKFNLNKVRTSASYQDQLDTLSGQVNSIQKQISYLDLYNITTSVDKEEDLASAITLLPPGEALVINVQKTFYLNNEAYKTGDIVLRLIDNSIIHVVSNVGGVYYPSKLELDDGAYKVTYAFSPSMPPSGTIEYGKENQPPDYKYPMGSTINDPTTAISFLLKEGNSDSNIYGLFVDLSKEGSNKFNAVEEKGVKIRPLIKFFEVDNGVIKEELVVEYTLSLSGNQWVISIDSGINCSNWKLWMQVK